MKTKQLFRFAMVFFSAIVMSSLMISCDKKEEPTDPTEPTQDTKAVASLMAQKFFVSSQLLQIADITVEFYDHEGNKQKEVMSKDTAWVMTVKTGLPSKLGYRVRIAKKAGFDYASLGKTPLTNGYKFEGGAINAAGVVVGTPLGDGSSFTPSFSGAKVEAWLDALPEYMVSVLYEFDAEGNSKPINW